MKVRIDKPSGASGELSPLLYARANELAKAAAADARLENMTALPEGARTRTPGTRFIAPYKNEAKPARLVPFEAALGDSYMLAFNDGVMRVFRDQKIVQTSSGTTYEMAHPFTDAQLDKLFVAQVRGTLFIASGSRPKVLVRNTDADWTLTDYTVIEAAVRLQNTDESKTIQASATTGAITLTASTDLFQAGHVGSVWRIDEKDFSSVPAWKAIETPILLGDKRRNKGRIYEVSALNAVSGDTGPNPPVHDQGEVFSSGGNVTWRFVSNAGGYVRIDAVASGTSASATVLQTLPEQVVSTPSYRWFEAAWSDVRGWPTAVSVVDQSLVWTRENEFWISKASDIYSFDLLDEEDSAVTAAINAPDGKLTEIVWVLPTGVLVLGTRSGEWVVRGQSTYERLTAQNARAIPQGTKGSAVHQPVMVAGGAVYIGRSRKRLHYAKFDAVTEQIEFQDFTTFSRHMLQANAMQLAWCFDPHQVLWVRMADGTLNGITLMPEQDVTAWHRRPFLNGKVLQIAAIQAADDSRTELWLGIERQINGRTRRYYEVMQPYFEATNPETPDASTAWFLDSALATAAGTGPFSTVNNLDHLEGQDVAIFADGKMLAPGRVTDGRIDLPRPSRNIVVGLPQTWRIRTLPVETNTNKGPTKGVSKASNRVTLHVHESAGGTVRMNNAPSSDIFPTAGVRPAAPLLLFSGVINTTIDPISAEEMQVTLEGSDALPFTLLGLTVEADIKDG